jgi:hypothetical protein
MPAHSPARQRGYGVITALITVVLVFGALVAVVGSVKGSSRNTMIVGQVSQLVSQANSIRSQVMACANGDLASGQTGDNGTGINAALPYVGSAAGSAAGGTPAGTVGAVANLYCPRTSSGSAWIRGASDTALWSGLSAVFLPPAPTGFSAWQFSNTPSLVKISTSYTGTNAELAAVVAQAAAKFGSAEVSTASANTLTVCIVVIGGVCS